jgi:tRNA(Phe) wybutosine-synthesizing methylase Tyw3
MAELFELIPSLPMPALLVFAAVLAAAVGVRYLGVWQGFKATAASSEVKAQVAAVIVDSTALLAATAALEAHNVEQREANMLARRQVEATDDLVKTLGALRDQLVHVAAKMGSR